MKLMGSVTMPSELVSNCDPSHARAVSPSSEPQLIGISLCVLVRVGAGAGP